MGVSHGKESVAKQNSPVNPNVRLARRDGENRSAKDDLLPAREAMAHIWKNCVRVVKEGAPGYGEQAEVGRSVGAEGRSRRSGAHQPWFMGDFRGLERQKCEGFVCNDDK